MPPIYAASQAELGNAYAAQQARSAYMQRDNRGLARRLVGITDTFPHLNAATAMALAEAGYDKDSVEVRTVGNLQAKRDQNQGFWDHVKSGVSHGVDASKRGMRVATAALDAPREYVEGAFRNYTHAIKTGDTSSIGGGNPLDWSKTGAAVSSAFNQTRLGSAMQVSHETGIPVADTLNNLPAVGRDGDVTALLERQQQSWFSGPNSLAEKRQVQNAHAAGVVSATDHRANTYGRWLGSVVGMAPGHAANSFMAHILKFVGSEPGANDPNDPRNGMTPEKRAAWERDFTKKHGYAPISYVDDSIGAWQKRAQKGFEGSIDALATFTPLDPVGYTSGAIGKGTHLRGKFGGPTVKVELKNDPVAIRPKVTDRGTKVVEHPTILVDGGTRPTVVFKDAHDFLMNTRHGDRLAEYVAAETNYERLAHVLGRDTDPKHIVALLDAQDPTRAKRLLLDAMGDGWVDTKPNVPNAFRSDLGLDTGKLPSFAAARLRRPTARFAQLAPSTGRVYRSDPAFAVEQMRRALYASRTGALKDVLTPDVIAKHLEGFARGLTDPAADWTAAPKAAAAAMRDALVAHGVQQEHADMITALWGRRAESDRAFWIDRDSGENKVVSVMMNGEDAPIAKAAASAEMESESIPLFNPQDITRAASSMRRLYDTPGWETLVASGDAFDAFWKFMVLGLRPVAFPMRNVSEAQGRMAVLGLDTFLNRPLDAFAWLLAEKPDSPAMRLIGKAIRREARGQYDPAGEDIAMRAELEDHISKFARAQEERGGPYMNDRVFHNGAVDVAHRSRVTGVAETGWWEGQRWNLAKLSGSPEFRMAIDAESAEHAKNMFWLSDTRKRMAARYPQLATREGSDAWMDQVVYPRLKEATGGNPELMQAIRQGRLNGVPLVAKTAKGRKAIIAELEKYVDDLPEFTPTPAGVTSTRGASALVRGAEYLDKQVFGTLMHHVSANPNNKFVNGPFMRQAMWQEATRLAPLASAEERVKLIANARKANMPKSVIRDLEGITGDGGKLTAEDVRNLSEAKAFTRWQDAVYNSHRKGNWTRSVRLLAPFAAAVADMYRFWSRALVRNPLILHRVELGMHAGRQSGFFYVDDNGQERFAYPLTRGLSMVASGIDEAFSGTVKGANLITSGLLPNVGPIVSWPGSMLLPDKPKYDELRRFLNPYGDPDASGGILEGLAPQNVQRLAAAFGHGSPEQMRRRNEAIADAMAYLSSTGAYGKSAAEQARLRDDAQRKGLQLYFVQAFAQSVLPASPKAETYFRDPSGRAIQISKIAADYRKFMQQDPDNASTLLLQKYGDAVFLAVTGGTTGSQFTTQEAHDLAREHPEVVDKYDQVWSYFTDPNSPYSHDEFMRQIKTGDKQIRSLKDRQVAAQTTLAYNMYHQYSDQFGPFPTTNEQAYLKQVKAAIKTELPLWDQSFDVHAAQDRVTQAFAAAHDKQFRDLPVSQAIQAYQQARQKVADWANQSGITASETGWARAKKARQGRDYLRQVAESLVAQVPEFDTFWQRVFSREMVDDVEGQP